MKNIAYIIVGIIVIIIGIVTLIILIRNADLPFKGVALKNFDIDDLSYFRV